ncbi:MAG: gamma-butyrobetaine dioxygenase [Gammaproteobacteria bacterium]|nr:gamma-butyrobetaine dioxygenase [Gammaproteobacteria bacterium]
MSQEIDLIKSLSIVGDELVVDWCDGKQSRLYSHWLRDHCQMPISRNVENGQRLLSVINIPEDTFIEQAQLDEAGNVCVRFQPEGHLSVFTQNWLRENCYNLNKQFDDRSAAHKQLWQADSFMEGLPCINYKHMCQNNRGELNTLRFVRGLGFCILENVPRKKGQVLDVISKIGYTRETNYGSLFEVRTEVNPNNLAYTNMGLGSHTDNPYRDPVPTVQLLHCLESSTEGGDSVLVDGFKAASVLREESQEDFDTLTGTWINYRFSDNDTDLRSRVPMIELNDKGEVVKVRYNNRSIDAIKLPADKIRAFYKAYRHWGEIIERADLKVTFKLSPGDLMLFDNTRVMHARTAFSKRGKRHLQGAYADLDGLYSLLNVLERGGGKVKEVTADNIVDHIEDVFNRRGAESYLGEQVTMAQHMLQVAQCAEQAGADDAQIVAALLHDIGHYKNEIPESALAKGKDNYHAEAGANFLEDYFPRAVVEPVRQHVAAKRYLCAVRDDYFKRLSPASVYTLNLQGGPMSVEEVAEFEKNDYLDQCVALRYWDEEGKDPNRQHPPFYYYRHLIESLVQH